MRLASAEVRSYRKWGRRRGRNAREEVNGEGKVFIRWGARGPQIDDYVVLHAITAFPDGIPRFPPLKAEVDHLHRPPSPSPPPVRGFLARFERLPGDMPSGEDTRLYNYGVPVIERSKLSFPALRVQEVRRPEPDGREFARNMRIRPGCAVSCSYTSYSHFLPQILYNGLYPVAVVFFFRLYRNYPARSLARVARQSFSVDLK